MPKGSDFQDKYLPRQPCWDNYSEGTEAEEDLVFALWLGVRLPRFWDEPKLLNRIDIAKSFELIDKGKFVVHNYGPKECIWEWIMREKTPEKLFSEL